MLFCERDAFNTTAMQPLNLADTSPVLYPHSKLKKYHPCCAGERGAGGGAGGTRAGGGAPDPAEPPGGWRGQGPRDPDPRRGGGADNGIGEAVPLVYLWFEPCGSVAVFLPPVDALWSLIAGQGVVWPSAGMGESLRRGWVRGPPALGSGRGDSAMPLRCWSAVRTHNPPILEVRIKPPLFSI